MNVTGEFAKKKLPEIVEIKGHPWYVGVQFHPEFQSRPGSPHPLFQGFVKAALDRRKKGGSGKAKASVRKPKTGKKRRASGIARKVRNSSPTSYTHAHS